jgi:DNA-binding MarR family transcriptional regulator
VEEEAQIAVRLHGVLGDGVDAEPGALPGTPGGDAWGGFLRAHASLLRVLDSELERDAGLSLSDFDVLVQLAMASQARMRMSELARRALISRSGMTRRVGQLEERGLVSRRPDVRDRRSVTVSLSDAGADLLRAAFPVHVRGIRTHFLSRLEDEELVQLRRVMDKVVVDCDFG